MLRTLYENPSRWIAYGGAAALLTAGGFGCGSQVDEEPVETQQGAVTAQNAEEGPDVEGEFVDGNPTCAQLAPEGETWYECRIEPVESGTYSGTDFASGSSVYCEEYASVTLDVYSTPDGPAFDWESNNELTYDSVFVKGGPNGLLYQYAPPGSEQAADDGLHSPVNPSNDTYYGLSHLSFCFDFELDVAKDADASFTRTYDWDIDKTVDPDSLNLFDGDTGEVEYTVDVTRTATDSDYTVSGDITVTNDTPLPATIESLTDTVTLADGTTVAADIDCGEVDPSSYVLAAGESLECTYEANLGDEDPCPDFENSCSNTVEVETTSASAVEGGSDEVDFDFSDATIDEVNGSVDVSDTNDEFGGPYTISDEETYTYTRTFDCSEIEEYTDGHAQYEHDNTASLSTGEESTATVTVDCYQLDVAKDADETYDKTWTWEIDKTVDPTEVVLASETDAATVTYTVELTPTSSTGDFTVSGDITITNPNPDRAATINSVEDIIGNSTDVTASVDCGVSFPYDLAADSTLTCSYSADGFSETFTGTNVATVIQQNYAFDYEGTATASGTTEYTGEADVDFSGATVTEIDECVTLADVITNADVDVSGLEEGDIPDEICVDDEDLSFSYDRTLGPITAEECEEDMTVENEITFTTNDAGDTGSDDAVVDVSCDFEEEGGEGCTPGYWKNHEWPSCEVNGNLIDKTTDVGTVFDIPSHLSELGDDDLIDALDYGGGKGELGAAKILLRAAVAALLNACSEVEYPRDSSDIVSKVNEALDGDRDDMIELAGELDADNNSYCPL